MTDITQEKLICNDCEVHFLQSGNKDSIPVVLLHGMKFQASTWKELGTLDHLSNEGFQALAVDMPGFGKSPACSVEQDTILKTFLTNLGLKSVILVGPSMGGRIAMEFAIDHPDMVRGLVLVGPVGVEENKDNLSSIGVPTLLVWGSEDQISPLTNCDILMNSIPGAQKIIIEGAPHPCYLDNPDKWHAELINFLQSQQD